MQTQKITLDFCQNDYKTVTVKQYDKDSRNLIITCTDNGAFYKLDSSTLQCNVKMNTPDDRAIYDTATIREDGTVLVTFSESMVYANGTGKLEIQFLDSSTKKSISTMILTVIIVGSVYPDDKIIASDEFNALTDALLKIEKDVNDANEVIERINTLEENVTTAEADRVIAEESRVLAESERVSAENTRIANENTRKTNETTRQTAESKRQTDTATAIANAEEATEKANEIAENCKDLMLGSGISITTTETTLEGSKDGLIRIESIGGVTEQETTSGKNLCPTYEQNINSNVFLSDEIYVKGSTTYTLSFIKERIAGVTIGNQALHQCTYTEYDSAGNSLGTITNPVIGLSSGSATCKITINTKENTSYIVVNFSNNNGDTNVNTKVYNVQLEKGTVATPYEPFSGGIPAPNPSYPMEIKKTVISAIKTHGKNFLKNTAISTTVNGVTFTVNADGSVTVKGTATANASLKLYEGELPQDCVLSGALNYAKRIQIVKKVGSDYHILARDEGKGSAIDTSLYNDGYIEISVLSGTTLSNETFYPMIRKTDVKDATYEPYQEKSITLSQPIELYSGDILTPQKINRKFGVKVFDGTETVGASQVTGGAYFYLRVDDNGGIKRPIDNASMIGAFCTRLIEKSANAVWNANKDGFAIDAGNGQNIRCRFTSIPEITSAETLQAKLAEWYAEGKPMLLVYPLAEETTEALPIADQIALNSLKSFDGVTYISTDSEVEPIITTEYGTSKTSAHAIEALNKVDNAQNAQDITTITSTTLSNGYAGRLLIDEIGGVTEQDSTSGKNLLDCSGLTTKTVNGVTFTPVYENGMLQYINANGTATAEAVYEINLTLSLPFGEYILNGCPNGGSVNTYFLGGLDANWGYIGRDVGSGATINASTDRVRTQIVVKSGVTISNQKFYPMIRIASVTDGTYEPYTGGQPAPNPSYPMEIKKTVVSEIMTHNEQLFNASRLSTKTENGITIANNGDGSFTISGSASASFVLNYEIPHNDFVKLFKAGKLYAKAETNTFPYFYINILVDGVNTPLLDLRTSNFAEAEITQDMLDNETSRLVIGFYGYSSGTFKGGTIKPMVYQDGDGTWKPYQEKSITLSQPIELYGMNGVQDVIDVERGKIVRNCGVKVFDGSSDERWSSEETACWIPILDRKLGQLALSVCSHFRYVGNFENVIEFRRFSSEYGYFGYGIVDTKMIYIKYQHKNLNEFISFLTSNPITVVYELATPTTEALPIADQIALNSLQTYDGITYVEFDAEIQPTFKAEYGTSKVGGYTLEGLLAGRNGELMGKSYMDRLTALETALINNI